MTQLEVINLCLRGIGRMPVASVDDPDLDAAQALATLEGISKEVQAKGWYFNREYNWKLTPDNTGAMYAPNNALEVIAWDCSRSADLTLRGKRIYNKIDHSYDMTNLLLKDGSISFAFILLLPFEELPHAAAQYIAYRTRKQFAQDMEGDSQNWQFNNNDEEQALAVLSSSETRNRKHNALRGSNAEGHLAAIQGTNSLFGLYGQTYPRRRNY